jgi:hypothetical protein
MMGDHKPVVKPFYDFTYFRQIRARNMSRIQRGHHLSWDKQDRWVMKKAGSKMTLTSFCSFLSVMLDRS